MNLRSHSISSLQGVLTVPGDKSISHRAAILGGLAKGVTEVDNFLCSEDCLNTLRAMEQLGAKVEVLEERTLVEGDWVGFIPLSEVLG